MAWSYLIGIFILNFSNFVRLCGDENFWEFLIHFYLCDDIPCRNVSLVILESSIVYAVAIHCLGDILCYKIGWNIDVIMYVLYYISQCMYVSYRFSQQPLTRLFWNFAWCFEIMSERQLSILVSIGCIITELWHNKGVVRGVISQWKLTLLINNTVTSLM